MTIHKSCTHVMKVESSSINSHGEFGGYKSTDSVVM